MDIYLQSEHEDTQDEELRDLYFTCINHNRIAEFYDENFITWYEKQGTDIVLKQLCLNPAHPLRETCALGRSTDIFLRHSFPCRLLSGFAWSHKKNKKAVSSLSFFCAKPLHYSVRCHFYQIS